MDRRARVRVLRAGTLEIRRDEKLALAGGRTLRLTPREFQLLDALVERAGRIVSREQLYQAVWDRRYVPSERSVDVYVVKLRRKLGSAVPGTCFIHTHVGLGYRLAPEPATRSSSTGGRAAQRRSVAPGRPGRRAPAPPVR